MKGLLQSEVFRKCKVYCSQKYLKYARFTAVRSIYNMKGLLQSEVFKLCKVYCSQKYLEYVRFTAVRSI